MTGKKLLVAAFTILAIAVLSVPTAQAGNGPGEGDRLRDRDHVRDHDCWDGLQMLQGDQDRLRDRDRDQIRDHDCWDVIVIIPIF